MEHKKPPRRRTILKIVKFLIHSTSVFLMCYFFWIRPQHVLFHTVTTIWSIYLITGLILDHLYRKKERAAAREAEASSKAVSAEAPAAPSDPAPASPASDEP